MTTQNATDLKTELIYYVVSTPNGYYIVSKGKLPDDIIVFSGTWHACYRFIIGE